MFRLFVWSLHDGRILHDRLFRETTEAYDFVRGWRASSDAHMEWYEDGTPQRPLGRDFFPEEALAVLVVPPDSEDGEKTDEN